MMNINSCNIKNKIIGIIVKLLKIFVQNINDAPILDNPIPDRVINEDVGFSFLLTRPFARKATAMRLTACCTFDVGPSSAY